MEGESGKMEEGRGKMVRGGGKTMEVGEKVKCGRKMMNYEGRITNECGYLGVNLSQRCF
jgi:hypothetical protein